jgi:hypothetical protein
MKKTFYPLIAGLAIAVLLSGCKKFNDQFDGLDAKTLPTNLASYTYTLTDVDYTTITNAVNKKANDSITYYNNQLKTASSADSVIIKENIARIKADPAYVNAVYVGANKFFNSTLQAKDYVPYLLNPTYLYADKGSVMNATYNIVDYGDTTAIPSASKFTLTSADYALMGTGTNQPGQYNNMSNLMPVLSYLNTYLKLKCPYAFAGDIKMVSYQYYDSNKTTKRQYRILTFDGLNWVTTAEQYNYTGTEWLYDPTVKLTMVKADYQLMVDYVLATPSISIFAHPYYKNEEYYWGFASRYSNTSFRLSYRNPYFTGSYTQPATIDPELYALTTTEEKVALMWNRLKGGMEIFAQLRFPGAVPNVSGIDVFYKLKTLVYYPLGTGGASEYHEYTFQCMAPASGGNPPTFKFISEKKVN